MIYARGLCRHGEMVWLANDTHVGRCLSLYGEFSELEADVLCQIAPVGGIVIEAGANIGALTLPLARRVGKDGIVVALEPQRYAFQVLCANLVLNEVTNVHAMNAAIGDTEGWIGVPVFDPERAANFGGMELLIERPENARREGVLMYPIDAMTLPRLDLIKADVEGMEAHVIRGALATIKRHRPVLYLEHSEKIDDSAMRQSLTDLDYEGFWHLPELYRKENFRGNAENVFPLIVSINMLFLPREREIAHSGFMPILSNDWYADHHA